MKWRGTVVSVVLLGAMLGEARAQSVAFPLWLDQFRVQAMREGISPATLDAALPGIEPDDSVIALDRKQPEGKLTFQQYLANTVTERRVRQGRELFAEYRDVLNRVSAQYGVQPQYLVALWGVESDYGNNKGNFSVVQSLATLGWEGRRADFFTKELLSALKISEREGIPPMELGGSWAGAMGDCQFMPSTYLRYAADGDGDGKIDIWNDPADVFASIASYLHALGWDARQGWGEAGVMPNDFRAEEADLKHGRSERDWGQRGFMYGGSGLRALSPNHRMLYAVSYGPDATIDDSGVDLVTENYQALLQWNRSRYFASSVGMLADRIASAE